MNFTIEEIESAIADIEKGIGCADMKTSTRKFLIHILDGFKDALFDALLNGENNER